MDLVFFFFPQQPELSKATRIPTGTNPRWVKALPLLCHSFWYSCPYQFCLHHYSFHLIFTKKKTFQEKRLEEAPLSPETSPHQPRGQLKQQQITAEFPSCLVWNIFGEEKTSLLILPWKTTIGTSLFLSTGGTTRAVLASVPQDPHGFPRIPEDPSGSGVHFASSQPNLWKSCLEKCWVMELMDKTGCSPRKGNLECLRCHETSQDRKVWAQRWNCALNSNFKVSLKFFVF